MKFASVALAIVGVFLIWSAITEESLELSLQEYQQIRIKGAAWPEIQESILKALADDKIDYVERQTIEAELDAVILRQTKDELVYFLKSEINGRLVRQDGERVDSRGQVYRPNVLQRKSPSPDSTPPCRSRQEKIQTRKNWVRSCRGYLQRNWNDQTLYSSKGELEHDTGSNPTTCSERFSSQVASCD